MTQDRPRIWELDFFRGIALILMIYYHIIYDLSEIFYYTVNYETGINDIIGNISGILFIFISGVSSSLSRNNVKRSLKVLGIALIITIASHLYVPVLGVKFGILHFLGVSMLLSPLFLKMNNWILIVMGALAIYPGYLIYKVSTPVTFLFPLGLMGPEFLSSDYYPLIPWIGFFIFGIVFGKLFYRQKQSLFNFDLKDNLISKLGRRTLLIYLLHQPVIIAVMKLLNL